MHQEIFETIGSEQIGAMEELQEKVNSKLSNLFSFYNEQEFLDEIHGVEESVDTVNIGINDEVL
ncbi:MAG TPA: hypothetical protein P5060_03380 [Candidatus Absconditabacterales bacterium]|nr:hypothetical protein [Candidatus Absconditabacterales bacterium]